MFPKYELRTTALSLLRLTPHREYPARFHRQVEMGLVTEGELCLGVGGKEYRLGENDLYLVFPNLLHGVVTGNAKGIVIIADTTLFPALNQSLTGQIPTEPVFRGIGKEGIYRRVFEHLAERFEKAKGPGDEGIFLGYIGGLLGELLAKAELKERCTGDQLPEELMQYLHEHYTEQLNLEETAKALGYSKYHLSVVIASAFGCNFRFLVNSFRIAMAQSLLLSTAESIAAIAYRCGYENQSSFNRVFRERTGMTPYAFRKGGGKVDPPQVFYR